MLGLDEHAFVSHLCMGLSLPYVWALRPQGEPSPDSPHAGSLWQREQWTKAQTWDVVAILLLQVLLGNVRPLGPADGPFQPYCVNCE
jgi:hypothetical protein